LTASEEDIDTNKICQLEEGESVAIPSGQFAVLLTEETITVPPEVIAFISMKTGLKGRGLVNVSGFHVDPGYSAPLRFAVFNAGPSPICVKQGEDSFLIWYANLDRDDSNYTKKESNNRVYRKGISTGDVSSLSGPVKTISVLAKKVDDLERTQMWMKIFIGVLSVLGSIVLGVVIFLSQEGIRSYLSKAASLFGFTE
jgi:dCTP deaminase